MEGYPVDNRGEKVDLTMAFVGTRTLFGRAGFTKAADTDSVLAGFPRVVMRLHLRRSEQRLRKPSHFAGTSPHRVTLRHAHQASAQASSGDEKPTPGLEPGTPSLRALIRCRRKSRRVARSRMNPRKRQSRDGRRRPATAET
jgi:hypothetical protein